MAFVLVSIDGYPLASSAHELAFMSDEFQLTNLPPST